MPGEARFEVYRLHFAAVLASHGPAQTTGEAQEGRPLVSMLLSTLPWQRMSKRAALWGVRRCCLLSSPPLLTPPLSLACLQLRPVAALPLAVGAPGRGRGPLLFGGAARLCGLGLPLRRLPPPLPGRQQPARRRSRGDAAGRGAVAVGHAQPGEPAATTPQDRGGQWPARLAWQREVCGGFRCFLVFLHYTTPGCGQVRNVCCHGGNMLDGGVAAQGSCSGCPARLSPG